MKELKTEVSGKRNDDDDHDGNGGSCPTEPTAEDVQISFIDIPKQGKIIFDATCSPSYIRFPTDLRLLNVTREKLEDMMDTHYVPHISAASKPRTYRNRT